jgi:hypothetical protein
MNRLALAILTFAAFTLAAVPDGFAQSLDDLNIELHGYATQAFLKTSQNNILTTNSSGGSAAWTEAVVNLSSKPTSELRIAVQGRFELVGTLGNGITLDFAALDYKLSDKFGIRAGKVKVPSTLYNTTQDIDPSYLWSLLPQSVYPLLSRNSLLSAFGGVAYGNVPLGERFGNLVYAGYGGQLSLGPNDGFTIPLKDEGFGTPNGYGTSLAGASLHWNTPIRGLLVGAADTHNAASVDTITAAGGQISGTFSSRSFNNPTYTIAYDHNKLSLASEYTRIPVSSVIALPAPFPSPHIPYAFDNRGWYGMASYKITDKLSAGLYDSQFFNRAAPLGPARFSKDWALSARYDFSQFLYAKAEQHFIDGTAIGYSASNNINGLQPDTRLTLLRLGVSF